jgi:hypothetical protein
MQREVHWYLRLWRLALKREWMHANYRHVSEDKGMEVYFRQLECVQKSVISLLKADAAEIGVTMPAMAKGRGRTGAHGKLATDARRNVITLFARETARATRVLELQGCRRNRFWKPWPRRD